MPSSPLRTVVLAGRSQDRVAAATAPEPAPNIELPELQEDGEAEHANHRTARAHIDLPCSRKKRWWRRSARRGSGRRWRQTRAK